MSIRQGASGSEAELPFAIYDNDNNPVIGHSFVSGQLKVSVAGGAMTNATVGNIVECGHGQYVLQLTSAQTSAEGPVMIYFSDGTNRDYSNYEMVASSTDEVLVVPFSIYEPDGDGVLDGVAGYAFSSGDVLVRLPGETSFSNATVGNIVEYGLGQYGLVLTTGQRANPGAIMVVFSDGVNRDYFGYELNAVDSGAPVVVTPPTPIPEPAAGYQIPTFAHVTAMLSRLPEYAKQEV